MNNVKLDDFRFDNINLLFVFIPLFLLIVIPFIISLFKRKFKFYNLLSVFLHLIICALLSLTIAGVKTEEIEHDAVIYIVADVSDTTEYVLDEMDEYIASFNAKMSVSSQLGIVAFGKDSVELVKAGDDLKSLSTAEVDKSATNIQDALAYTMSIFENYYPEFKKRIVLLSDGKETDGNATSITSQLSTLGIRIDAVYFNSDLEKDVFELQIDNITGRLSTFKNSDEQLTINVKSNTLTTATLVLTDNQKVVYEQDVLLHEGDNAIEIDIDTSETGKHLYVAEIKSDLDKSLENNIYYFEQEIHEKCRVLVISSTTTDGKYIEELISDNAEVTSWTVPAKTIPTTIEDYMVYDEIILADINLNSINNGNYLVFVDALEKLVAIYGKSLITIGGEGTYFDGLFYTTRLKDMLPVDLNPEDTKQRTALILLIDNSGSMSGSSLAMAKEGAIACLDVLTDKDMLGIITFEDKAHVVRALSTISNRRESIVKAINNISDGNGTMMNPGLYQAWDQMQRYAGQASNREIIVISDGVPFDYGQEQIAKEMAAEGIRLSTIGIGKSYNDNLLKNMAKMGNGEYYSVTSVSNLPSIMLQEVREVVMSTEIKDDIIINIKKENEKLVDGIVDLPNITGINFSKAKYDATVVLDTNVVLANGMKIDNVPIYAYWNYGSGKVSSFMSSVSKNVANPLPGSKATSWTKELFESEIGKLLFKQLITSNYPTVRQDNYLQLKATNYGYTSKIEVSVPKIIPNTELRATITYPDGAIETYTLPVINGKYTQMINSGVVGKYSVHLDYLNITNGNVYKADTYFMYSYSCEYDKFMPSDNILLWQVTDNSGTVVDKEVDLIDEIVNIEQEDIIYSKYYSTQLLILALILFVVDVIIRKLRWKDIINLFRRPKIKHA